MKTIYSVFLMGRVNDKEDFDFYDSSGHTLDEALVIAKEISISPYSYVSCGPNDDVGLQTIELVFSKRDVDQAREDGLSGFSQYLDFDNLYSYVCHHFD